MQRKTADARTRFIDRIVELARERAPAGHGVDIAEFVRQYYRNIGLEDLKAHSQENLAGSAMGHLAMAAVRKPGTPLIRVFNPDPQTDGACCAVEYRRGLQSDSGSRCLDDLEAHQSPVGRPPRHVASGQG